MKEKNFALIKAIGVVATIVGGIATIVSGLVESKQTEMLIEEKVNEALDEREKAETTTEES